MLVMAGVLLLPGAPATAKRDQQKYLALGDSVAFGFDPLITDRTGPGNFVGYPEGVSKMADLDVANASCPGETSSGFISLTGVDNSCRPYRAAFPLHVNYNQAQLDFAVAFLESHQHVKLVTIDIGANDLFVLQKRCQGEPGCIVNGLPEFLNTLGENLRIIYARIRGEADYRGQLVALTYYALDYNDALAVAFIVAVNEVVAGATRIAGGQIADGFQAFRDASAAFGGDACKAGLLIRRSLSPLRCDIHPSPDGRDVLARAIFVVVSPRGDDRGD